MKFQRTSRQLSSEFCTRRELSEGEALTPDRWESCCFTVMMCLTLRTSSWVLSILILSLSISYLVVLAFAFHWRIRKARNFHQSTFAVCIAIGCLGTIYFFACSRYLSAARSVYFFGFPYVANGVFHFRMKFILYFLALPSFPILTCYLIILFLWAEIYSSTSGTNMSSFPQLTISSQSIIPQLLFVVELRDVWNRDRVSYRGLVYEPGSSTRSREDA